MKLKNIIYVGLALMSLTACNDYLDVDAPSSYTEGFVYGSTDEVNRALDGVYTQALSDDLYGNLYQRLLQRYNLFLFQFVMLLL